MKKILLTFLPIILLTVASYGQIFIFGTVFNDADASGTPSGGDSGIQFVTVNITDPLNNIFPAVTDINGQWVAFIPTPPLGTYTINVDDGSPALTGFIHTTNSDPNTFVYTGVGGPNFFELPDGYYFGGQLTGNVYNDFNSNGTNDLFDVGLSGVQVTVTNALTSPVTTDGNGDWTAFIPNGFHGLQTVDVVEATLPAGFAQSGGTDPSMVTSVEAVSVDAGGDGYFFSCDPHNGDPQLTGMSFLEDSVRVTLNATLEVGWVVSGGDPTTSLPAGSWGINVVFPIEYELLGQNTANVANGTEFTWNYVPGTRTLTGISNQRIDHELLSPTSGFPSAGTISITVNAQVVNPAFPGSTGNLFIIPDASGGCEQAFNLNEPLNDSASAGIPVVSSVLPIQLVYFEGRKIDDRVRLDWKTEIEINNDFFEVQRSIDGSSFEVIGIVDGSGTTTVSQFYQFWDESLPETPFIYYRLRQVDYDLSYDYSNVVVIRNDKIDAETFSIVPNPATDDVTIRFDGMSSENASLSLYTTDGKLLMQHDVSSELNDSNQVTIDIRDYAMGIYFIELLVDNKKLVEKLNISR